MIQETGVKLFRDKDRIFPFYFMPDRDLGGHDVGQGVNENGGAREIIVPIADEVLVFLIGFQ
jgi:hypothetical protein